MYVGVSLTAEHPQKLHLGSWMEKKVGRKWGQGHPTEPMSGVYTRHRNQHFVYRVKADSDFLGSPLCSPHCHKANSPCSGAAWLVFSVNRKHMRSTVRRSDSCWEWFIWETNRNQMLADPWAEPVRCSRPFQGVTMNSRAPFQPQQWLTSSSLGRGSVQEGQVRYSGALNLLDQFFPLPYPFWIWLVLLWGQESIHVSSVGPGGEAAQRSPARGKQHVLTHKPATMQTALKKVEYMYWLRSHWVYAAKAGEMWWEVATDQTSWFLGFAYCLFTSVAGPC